jgi:hypothetical protein
VLGQANHPAVVPSAGSDQLETRTGADGSTVVYGHDLGHSWKIEQAGGDFELFLGDAPRVQGTFVGDLGSATQIDVDGGTFFLGLYDPTVSSVRVTTDATDASAATTIQGRWADISEGVGPQGRLWVLALPGSGTGQEALNDDLPTFVSWPSSPLRNGSLIAGGSDGVVSWALSWRNDHCIVLETLGTDPGNAGTSDCLPPWQDVSTTPLVGGVPGSSRATAAIVLTHRPPTAVTSPDLNDGDLQCNDIDFESNFAGSTICVFPVEVGQSVRIDLSQSGGPLNHPLTVEATPGGLKTIRSGATPPP